MTSVACRAPWTSMYFDQFGGVRACCANTGALLGDVSTQTLREIWSGTATEVLRDALAHHDMSKGCGLCAWQADQGGRGATMAASFDHLSRRRHRRWPQQMTFSLSNACNLQCVMCNGDLSSSIRAHRERLPPLAHAYGERFFEELVEFVPHLKAATFLGGEPFLGAESMRVMELLAERRAPVKVRVTTNGTVWSARHEAIASRLPMTFALSLDAATAETYEAIRVGARWDSVMANLDRFEQLAQRGSEGVSISHCLMVDNWHEFGDLLELAERRGFGFYVNTVVFPVEHSLHQLPLDQLRVVVGELTRREATLEVHRLRPIWDVQLSMVRARLRQLEQGGDDGVDPWRGDHTLQSGSAASLGAVSVTVSGRRS